MGFSMSVPGGGGLRAKWPQFMVGLVIVMVAFGGVYMLLGSPGPAEPPAHDASRAAAGSPTPAAPAPAVSEPPASDPGTFPPVPASSAPGQPLVTTGAPAAATPANSAPAETQGPEPVAARFFDAWLKGDYTAMRDTVADPPADLAERHRAFTRDLRVASLSLAPGPLVRQGAETAEMPFQGVREVAGLGRWPFSSVLRLGVRAGAWKVLWSPEVLHPALKDGGSLRLVENKVRRPAALTREGDRFPADSKAGDYFAGLDGAVTELRLEERPSGRVLLSSAPPTSAQDRTTISGPVQAAAARALQGVGRPAALVAVDVPSGEIRAVADTLGGKGAFNGLYPPGSAFKIVTAAALLRTGLGPGSTVACPGAYTIPNARRFTNDGGADHGDISLTKAFALSCNTTFVRQAYERLGGGRLRAEAADRFGFHEKPGLSFCRIGDSQDADGLGADAIGQNSVQASPLCMAEVAAAVASGTWRQAVIKPGAGRDAPEAPLDEGIAAGLRTMMAAVVTEGTAARAGLPPGTAGKTGTAEVSGGAAHAWFIGYRGSLAFAVLVRNGGTGGQVAAPVAAKFLKSL
ncbi:penicillin-binding protein [Sphaerisporangium siamense]|nr:penicillin-binding protein [Sphaerisporangium siamense]